MWGGHMAMHASKHGEINPGSAAGKAAEEPGTLHRAPGYFHGQSRRQSTRINAGSIASGLRASTPPVSRTQTFFDEAKSQTLQMPTDLYRRDSSVTSTGDFFGSETESDGETDSRRYISRPPLDAGTRRRGKAQRYQKKLLREADFVRVTVHGKREKEFGNLFRLQELMAHRGPILALEFSRNGQYMASAGLDTLVKVWRVNKRGVTGEDDDQPSSLGKDSSRFFKKSLPQLVESSGPYRLLRGHTSDITGLAWSKSDFLLSGSNDSTIRLWYPPKQDTCLRVFNHKDMVTCVAFHPLDENVFLSGSIGGRLRLWSAPSTECLAEADTEQVITGLALARDGKKAVVTTANGHCKFFGLHNEVTGGWNLRLVTQIDVRHRRSSKSRNISAITMSIHEDQFAISSNDSLVRVYRMEDKSLEAEYYGHSNAKSRFGASWSPNGSFMLCGSESRDVVLWSTISSESSSAKGSNRGVNAHETFTAATQAITVAHFYPEAQSDESSSSGLVIVVGSMGGVISIFQNVEGTSKV